VTEVGGGERKKHLALEGWVNGNLKFKEEEKKDITKHRYRDEMNSIPSQEVVSKAENEFGMDTLWDSSI